MGWRDDLPKLPRGFEWTRFDAVRDMVLLHSNHGLWFVTARSTCTRPDDGRMLRAVCEAMRASPVRGWCEPMVRQAQNGDYIVEIRPSERPPYMYHRFDPDEDPATRVRGFDAGWNVGDYRRNAVSMGTRTGPPVTQFTPEQARRFGMADAGLLPNVDEAT